jgi:dihydroorotase
MILLPDRGNASCDRRGFSMSVNELFDKAAASKRADRITIRRPDDFHVHLRDGAMLEAVLPFTEAQFARGLIMPNLVPPVTTVADAAAYRERILAKRGATSDFQPLMSSYLTDETSPDEIEKGFKDGVWVAAKLYPAGATTNAHYGVKDIPGLAPVFERMEKLGMPVLIHGEATDPAVDIFDREAVFMEQSLLPLRKRHAGLKIVIEHITTTETIDIVRAHASDTAGTITPHHLVINRTSLFQGGLRPHLYCLPVAKREHHRLALRKAATSGENCFFIGTDTAPHRRSAKEAECCSAGVFAGATALQTYVQVFDEEGALDRFEAFASVNGARFYGLELNRGTIVLERREQPVIAAVAVEDTEVVVFQGGQTLPWSVGTLTP